MSITEWVAYVVAFYYLSQGGRLFAQVSWKKLAEFHKIFGRGRPYDKKQTVNFLGLSVHVLL